MREAGVETRSSSAVVVSVVAGLGLAGWVGAAVAQTLSVSSDKASYEVGETITLTVVGDPQGNTTSPNCGIFGRLDYDPALTETVSVTQTAHTSFGGFVNWLTGAPQFGDGFAHAIDQIDGTLPNCSEPPDQLTASTVVLTAEAQGTVDVAWREDGGSTTLVYFGLENFPDSAQGTSFEITENGGGGGGGGGDGMPGDCGDTAGPMGEDEPCECGDTVVTDTRLERSLVALDHDPVCSTPCTGDGLTIGVAGLRLAFDQCAIEGDGTGVGLSVPSLDGVEILDNGRVVGFGTGLSAQTDDSRIVKMKFEGNTGAGAEVSGDRNELVKVDANGNGGDGLVVNGTEVVVKTSEAKGNTGSGMVLMVEDSVLKKDQGSGNGSVGIHVVGDGNELTNLDAKGNDGDGLRLEGGGATLTKVEANDNGEDGVDADGDGSSFKKCQARDNAGDGVVAAGSSLVDEKGNKGVGNGGDDCVIGGVPCQ